jgi:hypothetical protein
MYKCLFFKILSLKNIISNCYLISSNEVFNKMYSFAYYNLKEVILNINSFYVIMINTHFWYSFNFFKVFINACGPRRAKIKFSTKNDPSRPGV